MPWRLETSSAPVRLRELRAFVRRLCLQEGVDEDVAASMELAVGEAAANVMQHAYGGREDGPIYLEVQISDGTVDVALRHRGTALVRHEVPAPAFDGSKAGGFGVFIMEQCADEVRYTEESDGVACIRLIKRLAFC